MKTKDKKILAQKTLQELKKDLVLAQEDLYLLRLDKSMMKLKNTRSVFEKRKQIARILSFIKEKEMQNAKDI